MRLQALDIARFLAFCGMVLVNFRIAAQVTPGPDAYSWLTDALEGRAAALFVTLAGVGISLAQASGLLMLRRSLFLMGLGLLNMLIFDADILHFYAVYFLLAIPLLRLSGRGLWLVLAGSLLISATAQLTLNYDTGWNWDTLTYSGFWTAEGFLSHTFFNGWHPVFPWICFLIFGLWLGRCDLADRRLQIRLIQAGLVAAGLALLPGTLAQDPELRLWLGTAAIPPGPFYVMAGIGTSAVAIGSILRIEPLLTRLRLTPLLAAPGRQSLTLYVAHIFWGMGLLEGLGYLDGSLTPEQIFWISLGFCAACILYAQLWSLSFRRGPLEALMRALTELRR